MPRPPPAIRHAVPADLEPLIALEQAIFTTDRISRRQWQRHLASARANVLVAAGAGSIDAAAVVLYRRTSRTARLYSLAVAAPARGKGIGQALLAAAEADARARGCTSMCLEVRIDNTAALALYARRGYTRVKRLPGYYEDGADAWRHAKPLVREHVDAAWTDGRSTGQRRDG